MSTPWPAGVPQLIAARHIAVIDPGYDLEEAIARQRIPPDTPGRMYARRFFVLKDLCQTA